MVEILIGPSMIQKLWRKIFPKKVKVTATTEVDQSQVGVDTAMGIPDWVSKVPKKTLKKNVATRTRKK